MQDLPSPRKVLILEDDRRTINSLISAAIPRDDRLEILWARTLEEAIDALDFYDDELFFIVLSDYITDGNTVDFARHVQESGFNSLKISIAENFRIAQQLNKAGFKDWCAKIELPSYLLLLVTFNLRPWNCPAASSN